MLTAESMGPAANINGDADVASPGAERLPACQTEQADVRQNDTRRRRRKVSLACEACRARKIKCDGVIPVCGTCKRRRNTPEKCLYHTGNARYAITKEYINGLHDRIRSLERERRGGGPSDSSTFYRELQSKELMPSLGHELPHQFSTSSIREVQQDVALMSPTQRVQTSTQQLQAIDDDRNAPSQRPRDQDFRRQSDRPYLVGTSRRLEDPPQVSPSANGQAYFASPNNSSSRGDDIVLVRPQPIESPSVNMGSQTVSPRHESAEHESPINAMGTVSAITQSVLDSRDHFYGTSSVVSFSQQIHQTQTHLSGRPATSPSQAPVYTPSRSTQDRLLELLTSVPIARPGDYFLPPRVLADHLLECYWDRVHCLYPFVHQQSFISAYECLWSPDSQGAGREPIARVGLGGSGCPMSVFHCALNAIFALGCQFADLPSAERENLSETFFQRSKQLLHIDVLNEGSLALIQMLLIIAQFLQSTQFPNRCWNVVGLACRMAQGLGLYMDSTNDSRPFLEVEMRRRAWYGCVTLDLVVSMTLGRPMSLSDEWPVQLPRAIDDRYMESTSPICHQPPDVFSRTSFFIQTIKLYKILGGILTSVYNPVSGGKTSVERALGSQLDTIVKMDCALSDFESNIPPELYWMNKEEGEVPLVIERQTNVLHARFLHLRIVLYRPIFTQFCRKSFEESSPESARKSAPDYKRQTQAENPLYSSFSHQCSIACIQAAQELIDLISVTSQTNVTGAWWYNVFYLFTSAMVIILAELCPAVLANVIAPENLEASWQKCQDALESMSSDIMAAQKCRETLCAMRRRASPAHSSQNTHGPLAS
ncbi:fungal-specific transcription factor domain-containing protein [Xylogone sp. PMI_703]|nr:fungal-specific transcription factor domain-containing protein [Xylogone sp. PMI_703]